MGELRESARFAMLRNDKIVADGVVFPDGKVAIRWRGEHASTVVWDSIESAMAVHNQFHDTEFFLIDPAPPGLAMSGLPQW